MNKLRVAILSAVCLLAVTGVGLLVIGVRVRRRFPAA